MLCLKNDMLIVRKAEAGCCKACLPAVVVMAEDVGVRMERQRFDYWQECCLRSALGHSLMTTGT